MNKVIFSLILLVVLGACNKTFEVSLEPLDMQATLSAPADVYMREDTLVIDFAPGRRQPQTCTLEKLEPPRGEITAFNTSDTLKNGLTLRYDLELSNVGSGGAEGFLEGLLYSQSQLYKVTGHTQTELGKPKPDFCIDVFARLEPLEGTTF